MGEFNLSVTTDFEIPDFSAEAGGDKLMLDIAEKISIDSKKNIRQQTNVDGSPFKELADKTIKNKTRKGSASINKALIDRGVMLRAIKVFKEGKGKYAVGVVARGNPRRDLIALIHNVEGVNQFTRVIRNFLGVSERTQKWIDTRIERFKRKQLNNPRRTTKKFKTR